MFAGSDKKYAWVNTIDTLEQRLMFSSTEQEKAGVWTEVAHEWMNGLEECAKQAIVAFANALELRPDNEDIVDSLMHLYQATSRWKEGAALLEKWVQQNPRHQACVRFWVLLGELYEYRLGDDDNAERCFTLAFENNSASESINVFKRLVELYIRKKEWKKLEALCLEMIDSLGAKNAEEKDQILQLLVSTVHTHLSDRSTVVSALTPEKIPKFEDAAQLERIAELCLKNPHAYAQGVEAFQQLVQMKPNEVRYYEALAQLHEKMGAHDKRWCACAVLNELERISPHDKQFYVENRLPETARTQAHLNNELWVKHLFHPRESIYIDKIFDALTPSVRCFKVLPTASFGLSKKELRTADDTLMFSRIFFYISRLFSLPMVPELYVQETRVGGLNFAVTEPVSSACGSTLLSGVSQRELQFLIAYHLAYYRPEHYMRWVLPTPQELHALLGAALRIVNKTSADSFENNELVDQYVVDFGAQIRPVEREMLTRVVDKYIQSGESFDVNNWIRSVELTACRAGLLVCNDLTTAVQMVPDMVPDATATSVDQMIQNLFSFCVSDSYSKLREQLRIAIPSK